MVENRAAGGVAYKVGDQRFIGGTGQGIRRSKKFFLKTGTTCRELWVRGDKPRARAAIDWEKIFHSGRAQTGACGDTTDRVSL